MFKSYYRRRFREILGEPLELADGLSDAKVQRALRERDLVIPRALADYYAVAGRHEINAQHNRLLPIEELDWRDDKLVFMEEISGLQFGASTRPQSEARIQSFGKSQTVNGPSGTKNVTR